MRALLILPLTMIMILGGGAAYSAQNVVKAGEENKQPSGEKRYGERCTEHSECEGDLKCILNPREIDQRNKFCGRIIP